MNGIDVAATVLVIPPTLLLVIFVAEIIAGLRPLPNLIKTGAAPSTVVLIPAHNEAAGITAVVKALREADPFVDILVVADNCTDDTATRARVAGAKVAERSDPSRRGKGYALAFGRDLLAAMASPPACVVVLDADCTVEGQGIAMLARNAVTTGRAVQARYLQRPDLKASTTAQISNFAFLVKNLVRQRGLSRLGGGVVLTGTGMAFPWGHFADAPLANAELAEDLALGTWLTLVGAPPMTNESVHVWTDGASGKSLLVQRNRWERGFVSVAYRYALPLIIRGILNASRTQVWLGLHLMVPPLALLFTAASVALGLEILLFLMGAASLPMLILIALLVVASLVVAAAWLVEGRNWVSGQALLQVPLYAALKLPLYRKLLSRNDNVWVRTRRKGEDDFTE